MSILSKKLDKLATASWKNNFSSWQPDFFDLSRKVDRQRLAKLLDQGKVRQVVDTISEQFEEYNLSCRPELLKEELLHKKEVSSQSLGSAIGVWVFYPWRQSLVHLLPRRQFRFLRLARNRNLISAAEQSKLGKIRIGIVGLNVGNPAAVCLAQEGIGKFLKLADNDILSMSNFNRFRASLLDLGINKSILTARQIYEIDPYFDLRIFPQGVQLGKEDIFFRRPPIDILIEEVDNLPLKISLRQAARRWRVPVLMVTGNGPNLIVDIERYDRRADLPLLNGLLDKRVIEGIDSQLDFRQRVLLARDFIGMKYLVKELRKSFQQVGSTIAGIPQLAETSFLRGAVLCYFVRQLALGNKVPSGRFVFRMDKILNQK